jgi:hypothetical protein
MDQEKLFGVDAKHKTGNHSPLGPYGNPKFDLSEVRARAGGEQDLPDLPRGSKQKDKKDSQY